MALAEEFENTGNWLFRYRSYMPLVLFLPATLIIIFLRDDYISFHHIAWNAACLLISMIGMLIRAFTIGFVPRGTSGRNTKEGQVADALNTKGIYSVVRHPLYLGNFFMWFGAILYVGNPGLLIFCLAFFWIYYERIMFAEEQFIRKKFDQEFMSWAEKTPAFFPDFRKWTRADMKFSMRNVLKREYSGLFGNIVTFIYLNLLKNLFIDEIFWLDTFWQIAGIAGLIIYITLRSLKKYSRVLHTEGR